MMTKVDLHTLVSDLRALPRLAHVSSHDWTKWCATRGLGTGNNGTFIPMRYKDVATGLCTLRAYLRGKLHRMNPPDVVRDFNRSMRATGREDQCQSWNRIEWNRNVAMKFAAYYPAVTEPVAEEITAVL